jgi:phospholipase/carboxylesterase
MLRYEIAKPARGESRITAVLLHGRGSDRRDLFGLKERLPKDWTVVAPEAPFPAAPWGYGPGWAWYRFLGRNRPEPESFAQSLEALHEFITALPGLTGEPASTLALGGFSQGGTMSLAYALNHPGSIPLVLNFSGFLADHPLVSPTPTKVSGSRFFWGHGTRDPNIPFELAIEGRAALRAAQAQLEARDYEIGHWIDPRELEDAISWTEVLPLAKEK